MSLYQEKKGNSKAGLTTQRFSQMDSPLFLTDSFFLFIASMLIYYQTPNPLSHIYRFQLHNLPVKIGKPVSYHVQFHARQRRRGGGKNNSRPPIRVLRKQTRHRQDLLELSPPNQPQPTPTLPSFTPSTSTPPSPTTQSPSPVPPSSPAPLLPLSTPCLFSFPFHPPFCYPSS